MRESLLHQRDQEIKKIHETIISRNNVNLRYVGRKTIIDLVAEYPAPRFYITPKMAERYVLGFKRQLDWVLNSRKLDMIEDLVDAYDKAIVRYKRLSKGMIWKRVVTTPAKSFYVSKRKIGEIIFNYKGRNGKY